MVVTTATDLPVGPVHQIAWITEPAAGNGGSRAGVGGGTTGLMIL